MGVSLFGANYGYQHEQAEFSGPQAMLQNKIVRSLSRLDSHGVSQSQGFVRQEAESDVLDFLNEYDIEKLDANTRKSLEIVCSKFGLPNVDALILEQQRQQKDRLPKFGYRPS